MFRLSLFIHQCIKLLCIRNLNSIFKLTIVTLSLITLYSPLKAQTDSAFTSVTIGADFISNINEGTLHNYWKPQNGFDGHFSTPFYLGTVQFGINYFAFEGKSESYPDYDSFIIYLQWGYEFELPLNFSFSLNALAGLNQMSFDDTDSVYVSPGENTEKEFSSGISSVLSYSIFSGWKINLSAAYQRTFTASRINLVNISLGLSKSFNSPEWFKDFME